MSYVVYHKDTTLLLFGYSKSFKTEGAAKAALTRRFAATGLAGEYEKRNYTIVEREHFFEKIEKKVVRHNLMSKKPFETGINTPVYMDPSCETYWSM